MRIRILGCGWYGAHLARALLADGHDVHVFEKQKRIFQGASGSIPARLHIGAHYPRSFDTRAACQRHTAEFMSEYGFLTRGVAVNIYAVADKDSLVDYRQFVASLRGEFQFIEIYDPGEYGLHDVEGAIIVPERHILADESRKFFERELFTVLHTESDGRSAPGPWDLTIDCTFCAQDAAGVDRYEPCLVLLMEGPVDRAVTIMDGPFGSLYPWDPSLNLCSLSSALHTPFTKQLRSYEEARAWLDRLTKPEIFARAEKMIEAMARFYPDIYGYRHVRNMLSIRAMPRSGADTRLVSVTNPEPGLLRVRAGKIDAVLDAEKAVREFLCA
jgi:hypothetical protein